MYPQYLTIQVLGVAHTLTRDVLGLTLPGEPAILSYIHVMVNPWVNPTRGGVRNEPERNPAVSI